MSHKSRMLELTTPSPLWFGVSWVYKAFGVRCSANKLKTKYSRGLSETNLTPGTIHFTIDPHGDDGAGGDGDRQHRHHQDSRKKSPSRNSYK